MFTIILEHDELIIWTQDGKDKYSDPSGSR